MNEYLMELAWDIQHYLDDDNYKYDSFSDFIDANIKIASKENKEFKLLDRNAQRACLSFAFESVSDGLWETSRHVRNIAESISYDYHQMDITEPPVPPHNPLTETVDIFNFISEEKGKI